MEHQSKPHVPFEVATPSDGQRGDWVAPMLIELDTAAITRTSSDIGLDLADLR